MSEQINKTENTEQTKQTACVVRGVIAREKDALVKLTDIRIPSPGLNNIIVDIQACGVCHTDLAYRDGDITDEYPLFLGHETAGVISEIDEEVAHITVDDFVVLNWRAVCGECRACKRGEPRYHFDTFNASKSMTLADGTILTPTLEIGAFANATLVHESQYTKVDSATDPAVAGLLDCGVTADVGAATNIGEVKRGEPVAIIGCGSVGTAAITDAKLTDTSKIITIDVSDEKLSTAREFSVAETINSAGLAKNDRGTEEEDPVVKRMRELTDGFGADVVIGAIGRPETYKQTFYARGLTGRVVLTSVPALMMELDIPLTDVFSRGSALRPSWYGDYLPKRDFPMLMGLSLQNRLPLEGFVTKRISIGDVDKTFGTMKAGKVLRSVVTL